MSNKVIHRSRKIPNYQLNNNQKAESAKTISATLKVTAKII